MKKYIQVCRIIVAVILCCNMAFCNILIASAKNVVNIPSECLGFSYENSVKDMKKLAKKIGGMKERKNSKYTYYVSGEKMRLGVNKKASAQENESYIYIHNSGNKNVYLLGIKIGMSKEKAAKLLKEVGLSEYEKNVFWWGDSGCLKIVTKKGKVVKYSYRCSPTS